METHIIVVSSLKDIPKSIAEALTTSQRNILVALFRHKFYLECNVSLKGFEIEPLHFRPVDIMHQEMFKGRQIPPECKESFSVALSHFIKFLLSHETKDNIVFLRDKHISKGWPITLSQMEDSFVALSLEKYSIELISKATAKILYYSGEKKKEETLLQARNTTKSFW
ncbi:MAG: hypothetical protein RL641_404 [Candidatus Parcubacteria bacterium]|jgi:hypothetical protein